MSRSAIGGITIVHRGDAPPPQWVPVAPAQVIYNGCIVGGMRIDAGYSEGVEILREADGVADVTNLDTPYGVVLGNNNYTEEYSSTYKCEYITAAAAAGHGGSRGDRWSSCWPSSLPQPLSGSSSPRARSGSK